MTSAVPQARGNTPLSRLTKIRFCSNSKAETD
jgi:hypothetical protein